MIINIAWSLAGLILILLGANWLTDGASAIARRLHVSELVIGLTVVAMGTSTPELVVSLMASFNGSSEMAIGNVVGSNIFCILVIVGVSAIFRPVKIERTVMSVEIPIVILSSLVMMVLGNSSLLDPGAPNEITRVDGIFLLIAFGLFMRHTLKSASTDNSQHVDSQACAEIPIVKSVILILAGLGALVYGGDRFVAGASGIAIGLGVSEAVVGLTIVAAGTSLPELATSVVAAIKGRSGLAIGNVVGSCIFNVFMVLGVASVVRPLPFGAIGNVDLLTLLGASLIFWIFGWRIKVRTITRAEGALMAIVYVVYTTYLIIS